MSYPQLLPTGMILQRVPAPETIVLVVHQDVLTQPSVLSRRLPLHIALHLSHKAFSCPYSFQQVVSVKVPVGAPNRQLYLQKIQITLTFASTSTPTSSNLTPSSFIPSSAPASQRSSSHQAVQANETRRCLASNCIHMSRLFIMRR